MNANEGKWNEMLGAFQAWPPGWNPGMPLTFGRRDRG